MLGSSLPDLIALAFEFAGNAAGVHRFVAEAATYFRADAAALVVWPRRGPAEVIPVTYQLEADELRDCFAVRHEPGSLFHRLAVEPPLTAFGPTAADLPGWPAGAVLATVADAGDTHHCGLILIRSPAADFSPADVDALEVLVGYLRRAIQANRRFMGVLAEQRAARMILESAPRGILLLGQRGQTTYVNGEARRICNSGNGVRLDHDRLHISDQDATEELEAFLAAARSCPADNPPPRIGMRISRIRDAPPYQLIAYALDFDRRQAELDDREVLAVAMLHDPDTTMSPDEKLLDTYFGLTPAEANLTQLLCTGHSLPEAAKALSVSVNTARTHLRSVFQKIGVHSQSTMVQRVSQSLHFTSPLD
jgi:DNA-binding CsgD family transcriptional regulator/PAS domain-containing protein